MENNWRRDIYVMLLGCNYIRARADHLGFIYDNSRNAKEIMPFYDETQREFVRKYLIPR